MLLRIPDRLETGPLMLSGRAPRESRDEFAPLEADHDENAATGSSLPDRWKYAGLLVSAAAHVGLMIVLRFLAVESAGSAEVATVHSTWQAEPPREELQVIELPAEPRPSEPNPAGSRAALANLAPRAEQRDIVPNAPAIEAAALAAAVQTDFTGDELAEDVGETLESLLAAGRGDGSGPGDGDGGAFFGLQAPGKRFVFVVDCSRSMNHPHDSPSKTRFRRLKLEIVKSVVNMTPDQEFFIIFFNEFAVPMPARAMSPATEAGKMKYLRWMTGVKADGNTDPREALHMALKFRPDVIYFLTDGSFDRRIEIELAKIRQTQATIHTFAMGNPAAENMLKNIATRNGGDYHFIP